MVTVEARGDQVVPYPRETEPPVVHDETGVPERVPYPHRGVEAPQRPVLARADARWRHDGEGEQTAGAQGGVNLCEQRGPLMRKEVAERTEADREV